MQRPRAFSLLGGRLETGRIVLYGLAVGVLAGLAGTLFAVLLDLASNWLLLGITGYHPPGLASEGGVLHAFPGTRRVLLPALMILALLVSRWLPTPRPAATGSGGDGLDAALEAYHNNRARFDAREVTRLVASGLVALASGIPLGREGPLGALTSGLGALFGHWGRLSEEDRRLVFVAGLAAGLGLVLRAPLAGAVLAVEILYRRFEFEFEALTSAVLASVVAYAIYGVARGFAPLLQVPDLTGQAPGVLPAFFLLGLVEALASSALVAGIAALRGAWQALRFPPWLPLALAGLVAGLVGIVAPGILGDGLGWTQLSLSGFLPQQDLVSMLFWRGLVVLLLASAGAAGGLLTPSLVLGGLIGSLFGLGLDAVFPAAAFDPAAFTLTGMAAFLAGALNAPLGATLLVTEWSGYGLLVPLLLTTAAAYALIGRRSVLPAQPESRSTSPVHIAAYVSGAVQLAATAQPDLPPAPPVIVSAPA
ncbi:MAG TPA: chloride channel protein, partial [Deinococcales bacterium]|nr:chloride channel protein [Deinococcales bacterium]